MRARQAAITGLGVLSPYGEGQEAFWNGILGGHSCFRAIPSLDHGCGHVIGATLGWFDPARHLTPELAELPTSTQLSLLAARLAWNDARFPQFHVERERVGIYIASTYGLLAELHRFEAEIGRHGLAAARPHRYQELTLAALGGHLSIQQDVRGPIITLASGWCSGQMAMLLASLAFGSGDIDVAIVGAVETLDCVMHAEACTNGWLTTGRAPAVSGSSDARGRGLVQGEGAVILILESVESVLARGVTPYGLLCGVGTGRGFDTDSFRDESGEGIEAAICEALQDRDPGSVAFVSSMAGSHPVIEGAERRALERVFQQQPCRIPTSALASMIGHAGSCFGLFNVIAAVLAIWKRTIPSTLHCSSIASPGPHDRASVARNGKSVRSALANAFSSGGQYSSVYVEAWDHA